MRLYFVRVLVLGPPVLVLVLVLHVLVLVVILAPLVLVLVLDDIVLATRLLATVRHLTKLLCTRRRY